MLFKRLTSTLLHIGAIVSLVTPLYAQDVADPPINPQTLYYSCASCHGDNGEGNRALLAPSLAGLDSWYLTSQLKKFKSGQRGSHPEDTYGKHMTLLARTLYGENDITLVTNYIADFPTSAPTRTITGNPKTGKVLFDDNCLTCHGEDARGIREVDAPNLTVLDDWYMRDQLQKFRAGIRGNTENDFEGQQMVIMMEGVSNTNINDVIAYIQTLRNQP